MKASKTASASPETQLEDVGCPAELEGRWTVPSASGPPHAAAEAAAEVAGELAAVAAAEVAAEMAAEVAAGTSAAGAAEGACEGAVEFGVADKEADAEAGGAADDAAGKRQSAKQWLCCNITISSSCDPTWYPSKVTC